MLKNKIKEMKWYNFDKKKKAYPCNCTPSTQLGYILDLQEPSSDSSWV